MTVEALHEHSHDSTATSRSDLVDRSACLEHFVKLYESDESLAESAGEFLAAALVAGEPAVAIVTRSHRIVFQRQLQQKGFDVDAACASALLTFLDADATLSSFMVDSAPDWDRFEQAMSAVLKQIISTTGASRVRAYGEMVDLLWNDGNREGAIRLEGMWNELQKRHSFSLFCAYSMATFQREPMAAQEIFAAHTHVVGDARASDLRPTGSPPQHAQRLAQEIAQREQTRSRAEELYRFAQAVVTAQRIEDVYNAALDAIERALGAKRASILVFDADAVMRFRAWRGLSVEYRRAVEGHSPWTRDSVSPAAVLVKDAESDEAMTAYLPLFRQEGIASLAFVPLIAGGRLIGKFMVYYDQPHDYSPQELELATSIATHLASVTERFAAIDRLQETIRYHEIFAGILAHDLRNPLSAITTAAQLLLQRYNAEGERLTKPLDRILSSGDRMARMIEQLLDLTRLRIGAGVELQPRETNLAELCSEAVGELEVTNPRWKIEREVHGDVSGIWDPDRILQVVSNLVANAGGHGTAGAAVHVRLDGTSKDAVKLEIRNAGVIPEAFLPNLFDPFRSSTTRYQRGHSQGLGLGLFITKELINAHGGEVDVSSAEPTGTTFRVLLPRHCKPAARIIQ